MDVVVFGFSARFPCRIDRQITCAIRISGPGCHSRSNGLSTTSTPARCSNEHVRNGFATVLLDVVYPALEERGPSDAEEAA